MNTILDLAFTSSFVYYDVELELRQTSMNFKETEINIFPDISAFSVRLPSCIIVINESRNARKVQVVIVWFNVTRW